MLVYPEQRYALDPGQMPGAVPVPGPSTYPPQFAYGLQPGWGSRPSMVSAATSAVGNIPSGLSTVGMVAGLGTMFTANPVLGAMSNLDPSMLGWNVGAARYGAMRAAGMGVGGSLGAGVMAGLGPMALAMGAYAGLRYTGQQFMTGGREQLQLGQQLSGIGFANSQAMTGRGFGFGQLRQIGEMMREVDSADPFTTMRDLNKSMDQFMDLGMHHGVRDAKEFGKKFTEFAKAARDMARELGTTMEDAGRIFGGMRQAGFYTSADVEGNTRRLMLSKGLGMSTEQFGMMQGQGAAIARGSLMRGRAGARTATAMAEDLLVGASSRASGGTGAFTDEQLMDITGAGSGAEAATMMGAQFTGVMANFLRGSAGRGMLAGLGKQEGGAYTGELDQDQLAKFLSGKVRLQDLASVGGRRMTTAKARGSFKTSEHNIASSLLESAQGVEAVMASIQGAAKGYSRGALNEDDEMKLFMEKVLGVDARMADAYAEWIKHYSQTKDARMRRMREEIGAAQLQREIQQNYTLAGLGQQVKGGFSDLWSPVRQLGADFTVGAQQMGQGLLDSAFGLERSQVDAGTRAASLRRLASGTAAIQARSGSQTGLYTEDFSAGSVAAFRASNIGVARSAAVRQALDTELRWTAGGVLKENEVLPDGTLRGVTSSFLATTDGQRAQNSIRRAQALYANGDTASGDREIETARTLMGNKVRELQGSIFRLPEAVESEMLAVVAMRAGRPEIARQVLTKGTVRTGLYRDVKDAKKSAVENFKRAGLSSDLAEKFAGGGAGSELMIDLTRSANGFSRGLESALKDQQMSGVEGAEHNKRLATILSQTLGGTYTEEDVAGVLQADTQIRDSGWFSGGSLGERLRLGAAQGYLKAGGAAAREAIDIGVVTTSASAAANVLEGGTADLRTALGPEYTTALEKLRAISDTGGASTDQIAALDALGALIGRGESVSGMAGGGEFGRLGAQQRRGLEAAIRGSTSEIASEFGVAEDWIQSVAGPGKKMSLEDLVVRLSGSAGLDALGSGAGSNFYRRGETAEGRLVFDMQRMSESVDKLVTHIDAVTTRPITSEPIRSPDEKPSIFTRAGWDALWGET